jgi:NO-binding membrane sensor protein with MHYT domain
MAGSYDYRLVTLSMVIAVMASYTALDLGGRVTSARGWARLCWLVGGGATMGLAIWSMHDVGMLAFRLPVPVRDHWPTALQRSRAQLRALTARLQSVREEERVSSNVPS